LRIVKQPQARNVTINNAIPEEEAVPRMVIAESAETDRQADVSPDRQPRPEIGRAIVGRIQSLNMRH
jgi:hypothetical protein